MLEIEGEVCYNGKVIKFGKSAGKEEEPKCS